MPTRGLYGYITHTELTSSDPEATKRWCASVMGWTFMPPMQMPDGGTYHLFAYSKEGGGGIRAASGGEPPHTTPTVHVASAQESFDKALREGAQAILPPTPIMPGVTIALVRAPGGVTIGFSGP